MTDQLDPRRFVVVGAGGIGSWLLPGLCAMAEYKMPGSQVIIVDGDEFEPKNLERQNFSSLGNKAEVLAGDLAPRFPETMIIPQPFWVVSDESISDRDEEEEGSQTRQKISASELLEVGDIVVPVVDNFAARKVIMDAASLLDDVDVITGGNDENLFGNVYHYQRSNGSDVTSHPIVMHEEYRNPPDRNPGEMSCQQRAELEGGTQLIASNFTVAAIILARIQHCIVEGNSPLQHAEIYFDWAEGGARGLPRQPVNQDTQTQDLVTASVPGD